MCNANCRNKQSKCGFALGMSFLWLILIIIPGLPLYGGYQVKVNLISPVKVVPWTLIDCWLSSQGYYCEFKYPEVGNSENMLIGALQVIGFGRGGWFKASDSSEYLDDHNAMVSSQVIEARYNSTKECTVDPKHHGDLYLDMKAQVKMRDNLLIAMIIVDSVGVGLWLLCCMIIEIIVFIQSYCFISHVVTDNSVLEISGISLNSTPHITSSSPIKLSIVSSSQNS